LKVLETSSLIDATWNTADSNSALVSEFDRLLLEIFNIDGTVHKQSMLSTV
jgi:hypothetical protein